MAADPLCSSAVPGLGQWFASMWPAGGIICRLGPWKPCCSIWLMSKPILAPIGPPRLMARLSVPGG